MKEDHMSCAPVIEADRGRPQGGGSTRTERKPALRTIPMQDKGANGSKLVEAIDRAVGRWFLPPYTKILREEVLTAIKEAGYAVVPREPTQAMLNGARDWSVKRHGLGIGNDEATGCYRAMITAGEE